ncbi:MAG: AAA family ATPase [Caulobacteraceae bacterium]
MALVESDIDDLLGAPASPLDRPLTISVFKSAGAKEVFPQDTTLRAFAEVIRSESAPSKERLPWLKLAAFGADRTAKGSLRHDDNLVSIIGVEGDYDGEQMSVDEAVQRLAAEGVAAVVYTTPSHTPERPRWRVLAPTSQTLDRRHRGALCAQLDTALGGVLAPESFTASQAYYFGRIGDGHDHRVELVDGRPIDDGVDLSSARAGEHLPKPKAANDDYGDDIDLGDAAAGFRAEPDWARVHDALGFIEADSRDNWLNAGMAIHAGGAGSEAAYGIWTEWSRASDKFNERDQRRTWKGFGKKNTLRIGTLFHLAAAHGWNHGKVDAPPSRLTFLSPAECAVSTPRSYVVKGILARGDIAAIFGQPGAGKSLIAPYLGYRTAQGERAFGLRTRQGPVLYVAAEDAQGMRGRVTALSLACGDAPMFKLVEGVSNLLVEDSPDLAALIAAVEDQRPSLVFIDTLALAFPGLEENSSDGMSAVVEVARRLAAGGAAVVIVTHGTKAEGTTPRGHSVLNGALDMALQVEGRDSQGIVRARLTKNRNGSCDLDIAFTIGVREIGVDEDGDSITAAIVNELAPGLVPRREKTNPAERAALTILQSLLLEDMPVDEATWRNACIDGRSVSASDKEDSRRKATTRAIEGLHRKGFIRVGNGYATTLPGTSGRVEDDPFDEAFGVLADCRDQNFEGPQESRRYPRI